MADIISRLKLESGEFDSKIKRASQELTAYSQHCRKIGLEMGYANKDAKEFAKSLGSMQTTATTTRGKVSELSDAFVNLKAMYNQMTDVEKQGQFGKNLAASLDQLKQRTQQAKQELADITKELNGASNIGGGGGLFSGDKLSGMLQVFGGNLMTKGLDLATSAVSSLASEIGGMITQGVELAKQGEGIRIAFQRLGRGDILDGLREATHGTVTDLELMKAAVKFNDFKLPLEELGTMLAFAQQKAKDTGQSVDYMTESIVTGLGRKSLMILDNLGLSANEIKEKMKQTGDMTKAVGAIIREQMSKAGDYVETAADRAAQANVSLQNKMEELGRKFVPLEEASSNFWTSMKIGILDVIGGPLTNLLNKLTEAGRLMNAYGKIGGNAKVGRMTSNLAGASEGNRQSVYQQQQAQFWKYINPREQHIKDIRAWQSGDRNEALQKRIGAITEKYGSLDATKIQAEVDAAKKMLSEYQQAAKQILNPMKADIDTKGAEQNVESLKVKLIELEAQRKKAIAAGDTDLSKNLAKQISQVKSDIKGLGGSTTNKTTTKTVKTEEQRNNESIKKLTDEYLKATDERRAAIRAEIKDLQDRNKEVKRLTDEAQGIKIGDSSLPALTRQLQEFQQQQSQSANGKEWDEYQKKIDATNDRINVLKGNLPKDKQATFTMNVNAEQLEQLRAMIPANSTIKVNVEQGNVDLPSVPTDDKTIKVNITADTAEAMKQVRDMVGDIEGMDVVIEPKVEIQEPDLRTPFQRLQDSIRLELSAKNVDVDKNTLKSLTEVMTKYDIHTGAIDMQQVMEQTEELTKGGMTAGEAYSKALQTAIAQNLDLSTIQQRIGEGIDIPESTWQALQDEINAKLKDLGIEPIQIDFSTGNVKKQSKEMSKDWQAAAQAVQAVGSAMSSIEDPAAKIMGTIGQAIASIALGFAQATASDSKLGVFGWIAAIAAGTATMISTIAAIHSATGYANGGMIKGNSYSGDNLMAQGPSGELIGLNAGEIVLNRAQTANVASALQGSGIQGMNLTATIRGEQIRLALNNNGRRTGKGEYVQTNRR